MESYRENIFIHSAKDYGPEDKFTGHLSYLLNNHREIGQAWLDHLRAGTEGDTFRSAKKHAYGNSENMPNFVIVGDREDVICEHKLDAPLGHNQLERYLTECSQRGRTSRLALVSATGPHDISPAVKASGAYLRPTDRGRDYFRWEDLYPIVSQYENDRLAWEFRGYMEYHGLRPSDIRQWTDLFTNPERMKDFAPQWADTIAHFASAGVKITKYKKKAPAVLFQGLRPWLTHLYLKPSARPLTPTSEMRAGRLSARGCISIQSLPRLLRYPELKRSSQTARSRSSVDQSANGRPHLRSALGTGSTSPSSTA